MDADTGLSVSGLTPESRIISIRFPVQESLQLFKLFGAQMIAKDIWFTRGTARKIFRCPPSWHVVPSLHVERDVS
jgi:hypothetical protein